MLRMKSWSAVPTAICTSSRSQSTALRKSPTRVMPSVAASDSMTGMPQRLGTPDPLPGSRSRYSSEVPLIFFVSQRAASVG